MRPPFDPDLSAEELNLLAYLKKRGGLRPERLILRERRKHPGTLGVLEGLRGSWVERTIHRGETHWSILSLSQAGKVLRAAGRDPPHHRHRTRLGR